MQWNVELIPSVSISIQCCSVRVAFRDYSNVIYLFSTHNNLSVKEFGLEPVGSLPIIDGPGYLNSSWRSGVGGGGLDSFTHRLWGLTVDSGFLCYRTASPWAHYKARSWRRPSRQTNLLEVKVRVMYSPRSNEASLWHSLNWTTVGKSKIDRNTLRDLWTTINHFWKESVRTLRC